jgi:tetratricopeptide (TPR) repeat protein
MSATASFYVTGGTLKNDALCYVERQADQDLYASLMKGEYCYVLTARQMGKSSLMVRTAHALRRNSITVAVLDLTGIGQNVTAEQWYFGLLDQMARQLRLEDDLDNYWAEHTRLGPLQRWMHAVREVVLPRSAGNVVIFIDEIDAVRSLRDKFSTDEFFAAIRECYNRRTDDPNMGRLTFCLIGVATPADLIYDTRTTPFNIGRRIELGDFTLPEAGHLAKGLHPDAQIASRLLQRIYYWTDGHPYLTQRLCRAAAEEKLGGPQVNIDRLCDQLFLSQRARERDDNLIFVRESMMRREKDRAGLLDLFDRVRRGKKVVDDELNPLVTVLRLSGITRARLGRLQTRNRIYEQVFDIQWVQTNMPDAERRRQRRAYRLGLLRASGVGCVILALAILCGWFFYNNHESQRAQEELRARQEIREQFNRNLDEATKHEADGNLDAVSAYLERAEQTLNSHPEFSDENLRSQLGRRQSALVQKQEQAKQQQARKRFLDFERPYDDALFYKAQFTGLSVAESRMKALSAAQSALAIYGIKENAAVEATIDLLDRDQRYLSDKEHSKLALGCYELLLIWAEIEATPLPEDAASHKESRARAEKALALLQLPAQLGRVYGLESRSYRLSKLRYEAQKKGEKFDSEAAAKDLMLKPLGRLDGFLAALGHYEQNEWAKAIDNCEAVLKQHNDDFWSHYLKALCQLRRGHWVEAKVELTVSLSLRPDFVWPRLLRGFAESEQGIHQADKRLADSEFDAAVLDFDEALKADTNRVVQYVGLTNRGVLNIRRERWDKAIGDLQQAIKQDPDGFQGYLNLAQALQGSKQLDRALAEMNTAIALAPNLPVVYESRAKLHLLRNDLPNAQVDLEHAVLLEGKSGSDLANDLVELGHLQHRQANYLAALASFAQALKLKPDSALIYRLQAESFLALNKHVEAGKALDAYLARSNAPPLEVYQARGRIHAEARELHKAIEMYALAIQKDPKDIAARMQRGWAYIEIGATHAAVDDFGICLDQDKLNVDALVGRASARIQLEDLEEALKDAASAEDLAANQAKSNPRLFYTMARIYAFSGAYRLLEQQGARFPPTGVAGPLERSKSAGSKDQPSARPQHQRTLLQLSAFECRDKALSYLRRALEALPAEQRMEFLQKVIQRDPAFSAIQSDINYSRLMDFSGPYR